MFEDFHLHHLAAELDHRLRGAAIQAVERSEGPRLRLRLAGLREALVIGLHSKYPFCLTLERRDPLAEGDWRPVVRLGRDLVGAVLLGAGKADDDRSIHFPWVRSGEAGTLLVLLHPVSPAVVCLDAEGVVRSAVDPGEKHGLVLGQGAPPRRPEREAPTKEAVTALLTAAPASETVRRLVKRFRGVGPTAAEEAMAQGSEANAAEIAAALLTVLGEQYRPSATYFLYRREPCRPGRFALDPRRDFRLSAGPLRSCVGWERVSYDAVSAAMRDWVAYVAAFDRFLARKARLSSRLQIRRDEAGRRVHSLARETARSADPVLHRRHGELILMQIHRLGSSFRGLSIRAPDLYQPGAPEVEIPLQPDRDLRENADRCFLRHRKALAAQKTLPEMLAQAKVRLALWEKRLADLAGTVEAGELDRLEAFGESAARPARKGPAPRPAPEGGKGYRTYVTTEGHRLLVGKNAAGNDRLTFRTARPDDYWFHAADWSGSHVVLVWGRRADAPMSLLHEAAAVAAWHSGARTETVVDVKCTRCKHVRKIKGAVGRVSLARASTFRVRPELPSVLEEDELPPSRQ